MNPYLPWCVEAMSGHSLVSQGNHHIQFLISGDRKTEYKKEMQSFSKLGDYPFPKNEKKTKSMCSLFSIFFHYGHSIPGIGC